MSSNSRVDDSEQDGYSDFVPASQMDTFKSFYARYHVAIVRYAARKTPRISIAEDIAAETWIVAWQRWSTRQILELPWLYRVASNKIADYHRAQKSISHLLQLSKSTY